MCTYHNAASARISGFEADVNWLAAPGLTITGGMAYTHATLSEDFCGFSVDNENVTVCPGPLDPYGPQAPKGTMLPGTPPPGELPATTSRRNVARSATIWA